MVMTPTYCIVAHASNSQNKYGVVEGARFGAGQVVWRMGVTQQIYTMVMALICRTITLLFSGRKKHGVTAEARWRIGQAMIRQDVAR